jgi:hypothetical protein
MNFPSISFILNYFLRSVQLCLKTFEAVFLETGLISLTSLLHWTSQFMLITFRYYMIKNLSVYGTQCDATIVRTVRRNRISVFWNCDNNLLPVRKVSATTTCITIRQNPPLSQLILHSFPILYNHQHSLFTGK